MSTEEMRGVTQLENDLVPAPKQSAKEWFYPESLAGGFTRFDGTINFYSRVNAIIKKDMTVLDFGAGRGEYFHDDKSAYRVSVRMLKGKVAKVIGMDVDPVVTGNDTVDEAIVLEPNYTGIPLPDSSIDVIVSDFTFEHIDNPSVLADEFLRILKPGGWICARTPNLLGYIGVGANLVPNKWHVGMINYLKLDRKEEDVFPTVYKMNTKRAIRHYFPPSRFEDLSYTYNPEPTYFASSKVGWAVMAVVGRLLPPSFAAMRFIFLRKR